MINQSDFKFVKDDDIKYKFYQAGIPSQYWGRKITPVFIDTLYRTKKRVKKDKKRKEEEESVYDIHNVCQKTIQVDWWNNIINKINSVKSKISIGFFPAFEKQEDLSVCCMMSMMKTLILSGIESNIKQAVLDGELLKEYSLNVNSKIKITGIYGNCKRDGAYAYNLLRAHIQSFNHCIFSYGSPYDVFMENYGIQPTIAFSISREL